MVESYCADHTDPSCSYGATFAHEATHVGQFQQGQQVFLKGAGLQFLDWIGVDVYKYKPRTPRSELSIEQQGQRNEDNFHFPWRTAP
ncbi:hypothetical protein WQE_34761 [Paraburkholderia hospita]|uniref:Uncharacterized protein n=1 Tax=Paraburkholderia hospita TaxID=169430 RepID=A0ABP2PFI7_9BURK|nr:hypothetical protein WQE_34761 [Paraburkholderia hospita]